jgi:CRP-like cAMP-binding protein
MDKEPLISFIQQHSPSTRATIEKIALHFEEKTIEKNEFFVQEGKISNYNFFMIDGFMRAFTYDLDGNEVTTNFYQKGTIVFEALSFYKRVVSLENIQAVTDCKGFALTFEKMNMLFHAIPEFREFGRSMLVKEFAAYKQRTLSLINKSAEERYAELIRGNKEIFQYAQLKYVASFLGITDTSLSRIRREYFRKN